VNTPCEHDVPIWLPWLCTFGIACIAGIIGTILQRQKRRRAQETEGK
jgi:hypothetical protein